MATGASGPTGAAIFGSTLHDFNVNIQGMYSGYFNGEVYVATKLTVPTIVSPSDIRLKENVISVSETENTSRYLDRLLDMNVIEYNYKRPDFLVETQSSSNEQFEKALKHRHVGFVAQEMQELFPNLVEEGQDGYLGVNYVELVPVLIRAIQELKQEFPLSDTIRQLKKDRDRQIREIFEGIRLIHLKKRQSYVSSWQRMYRKRPSVFSTCRVRC